MHIVKGRHSVLEALKSDTQLERVVMDFKAQRKPDMAEILSLAKMRKIKVQFASAPQDQGVVAYVASERQMALETLLDRKDHYPVVVIVDHVEDPYNFGAILRTAETLGIKGIIYPKDRNSQLTAGVIKASSGAVHHLDLVKVVNLASAVERLKEAGYWIYGTADDGAVSLPEFTPNYPMALVLGNESRGVSNRLSKMMDVTVRIPLKGKVSSLNVSVAAGILIYHVAGNRTF